MPLCCSCKPSEQARTVSAPAALAALGTPIVRTARQYVGGASGFDSPFDAPSPILTPIRTMQQQEPARFPWLILILAAGVVWLYFTRRR